MLHGGDGVRDLFTVLNRVEYLKNFISKNQFDFTKYLDLIHNPYLAEWYPMGPIISTTWQSLSPLYYFILTPFFILTNYNYVTQNYITTIIDVGTCIMVYIVINKIHGFKNAVIAMFIYSFNTTIISGSTIGLNPGLVPPFTVLLYLGLYQYLFAKKEKYLVLVSICVTAFIMFHASSFFLIPSIFIVLIYYRKKIPKTSKSTVLISILIFIVLGITPYLVQEKMTNYYNLHIFKDYFIDKDSEQYVEYSQTTSLTNYLKATNKGLEQAFFPINSQVPNYWVILLLALLIIHIKKANNKIIPIILLSYYLIFGVSIKHTSPNPAIWWYLPVLIPLVCLFFAINIEKIKVRYSVIVLIIYFLLQANIYYKIIGEGRNTAQALINANNIVRLINKNTQDTKNFYLDFYTKKENVGGNVSRIPFTYYMATQSNNKAQDIRNYYNNKIEDNLIKSDKLFLIVDLNVTKNNILRSKYTSYGFNKNLLLYTKNNVQLYMLNR